MKKLITFELEQDHYQKLVALKDELNPEQSFGHFIRTMLGIAEEHVRRDLEHNLNHEINESGIYGIDSGGEVRATLQTVKEPGCHRPGMPGHREDYETICKRLGIGKL